MTKTQVKSTLAKIINMLNEAQDELNTLAYDDGHEKVIKEE